MNKMLPVELGTNLWIRADLIEAVRTEWREDYVILGEEATTMIFMIGCENPYISDWKVLKVVVAWEESLS